MMASRFPYPIAGDIFVYVGGHADVESKTWLEAHNITFCISATGHHNEDFDYPIQRSDAFNTCKLTIGYEGGRMGALWL